MIQKLLSQLNDRWIAHRMMGDDYGSKVKAVQLNLTFHVILFLLVGPFTYYPALLLSRRTRDRGWRWVFWAVLLWFCLVAGCFLVLFAELGPFAILPAWLFTVPLCYHTAVVIVRWRAIAKHFHAVTVEQNLQERTQADADKRKRNRERTARAAKENRLPAQGNAVKLGLVQETVGDLSDAINFRIDNEWLTFDPRLLSQHTLAVGAPNAGKSTLLLHLIKEAMRLGRRVYVIDGKGSTEFAEACINLMQESGPVPWVTVGMGDQGTLYNPFVGQKESIYNRLLALMGVSVGQEGGAAYYADIKRNMLQLVCCLNLPAVDAPRTLEELRTRLTLDWLRRTYAGQRVELQFIQEAEDNGYISSLSPHVAQLVRAFSARTSPQGFTFDNERVGMFSINALSADLVGKQFFEMMIEDVCDWVGQRKEKADPALIVVDEFGTINTGNIVRLLMQAREMSTGVVLCTQSVAFGSPQTRADILACTAIKIAMRSDDVEPLLMVMGTYKTLHPTWQSNFKIKAFGEENQYTGLGSSRPEDEMKAHPDLVARLHPGESYVSINRHVLRVYTPRVRVDQRPLNIKRTQVQEPVTNELPSQGIEQEVADLLAEYATAGRP